MVVIADVFAIDVLADVEVIVVGIIVIVLKFALPGPYSVDVPSGVVVDLFMDVLASVMIGAMLVALPGTCIEVLPGMTSNTFAAVLTAFKFSVSTPLEEFSR